MSDPLSVAASITGLIALAGQLYIALDGFISNVRDAPLLAGTIQAEVKSFWNSLNALQIILTSPAFRKSRRATLISADYVVVSFTDAVLVFSQLESHVLPLTKFAEFGVVARMEWTRKKGKLNELVGRLQWQKHTLVLQLNILSCASDIEAERNRQVLDNLICERLGKDRDMERRLELVEQQLQIQGGASICDRASIISSRTIGSDHTIRAGDSNSSSATLASNSSYQHAFEELLNNSWVYKRNQNREEDMSMRSSVLRISAWSILSDMSLANISIIAVMSLPVQIQELANGGWYSSDSHSLAPETGEAMNFSNLSASKERQSNDANQTTDRDRQRELFNRESREQSKQFKAWMKIKSDERSAASGKQEAETQEPATPPRGAPRPAEASGMYTSLSTPSPENDVATIFAEMRSKRHLSDQSPLIPRQPFTSQVSDSNGFSMLETQVPLCDTNSEETSHYRGRKRQGMVEQIREGLFTNLPDIPSRGEIAPDLFQEMLDEARRIGQEHSTTPTNGIEDDSSEPRERDLIDQILDEEEENEIYSCKGCGEILEEGKAFELAGNRWHIECFKCNTCGVLLDSDANLLLLGDGSLICKNCTYSCSACDEKIEDLAILTGDQAYCANCFRCRNCKRKIEELRYARTTQGLFCMDCHNALMERRRKKGDPRVPPDSSGPKSVDDTKYFKDG